MSQRAHEPGSDLTSYPPDAGTLTDWDRQLSVIAEEAADLQQELSRLRAESEAVAQLLEQRERELEQKTASLTQLTAHRDQTEKRLTVANTSLSEAQALLEQDRERIASLEQLLEQRQADLERATALEQELSRLRAGELRLSHSSARATGARARTEDGVELEQLLELRQAEPSRPPREAARPGPRVASSSTSSSQEARARYALEQESRRERIASLEQLLEQRQADLERATALEQELHALRARVAELEELESSRPGVLRRLPNLAVTFVSSRFRPAMRSQRAPSRHRESES